MELSDEAMMLLLRKIDEGLCAAYERGKAESQ